MHEESYTGYHWPGEGPSILLLHGWESNSSRWRPLIKKLRKKGLDIYALDAPAHCNSTGDEFTPVKFAEAADYIIKEKEIKILLGHSAGGFAALYYMSAIPNKIKAVIAMAPTYSMTDVFTGMQNILGLSSASMQALRSRFIAVYDVIPEEFNSANFVKDLSLPSLLIHDEHDLTLDIEGSDKISKVWRNCKYKRTSGFGHRLRNSEVDNLIINFIMSL